MRNRYEIRGDITVIFLKRRSGEVIEAMISTDKLEKVHSYKCTWWARKDTGTGRYYVQGTNYYGKAREIVHLHRLIMDCPSGMIVDHINLNTLDNTTNNLRVVTDSENKQNANGAYKNSKSGVRGVYWHKAARKWRARVKVNNKIVYTEMFNDLEQAKQAVIKARKIHMPYAAN